VKKEDMLVKILEYYKIGDVVEKEKKIKEYLSLLSNRREWAGLTSRFLANKPERALVDSLAVLNVLEHKEKREVIDVGSGGGLVGVVLAIACSEWEVTLAESSRRKAAFLVEAIGSLKLENAMVVRERAERLSDNRIFDFALGRGAGGLVTAAPIALDLLRKGGLYVAVKGSHVANEVNDAIGVIEASGGTLVEVVKPKYPIEFGIPDRVSLVVIRKR
jgi:16S rRNA (guanine527-N7)-methyltransferase